MDHVYEHEIIFDYSIPLKKEYYQIEETKFFPTDGIFLLYLDNNQYREVTISSNRTFKNLHPNQSIYFHIKDVISFSVKLNSNKIYFKYFKYGNKELLNYWLIHTFLPILFTLENKYYFIHAGAVEVENEPVLFIANSFGGKSTLTDFFIKKNHTMVSDDKVATYLENGNIYAVPSYPYHRPYRKMEDLGLFVENFSKKSKPISKIYNLIKSSEDAKIVINKITGIKKFTALRYATDIDLQVNKKSRFNMLSTIANKVKVYDITIPWNLDRLEEVYQTIIEHNKKG